MTEVTAATPDKEPLNAQTIRMMETIDEIGDNLAKDPSSLRSIDEKMFVTLFIPLFCGEDISAYPGLSYATWINQVAGSLFQEVVVLSNKDGTEIFRVPPLLSPTAMKPLSGDGPRGVMKSMTAVVDQAMLLSRQGVGAMWAFMDAQLRERNMLFDKDRDDTTYLKRWVEIFARYKRTPKDLLDLIKQQQPEQAEESATNANIQSYDDF